MMELLQKHKDLPLDDSFENIFYWIEFLSLYDL